MPMRSIGLFCLMLVIVAAGCTRKPPVSGPSLGKSTSISRPVAAPVNTAWNGGFTNARPQTSAGWADRLHSTDQFAQAEAAKELGGLGKEGFPYLYKGMQSGPWEMRLACLRAAPKDQITSHPAEMVPLLTQMLGDSQPEIQKYAAVRLGWFGASARSAFPLLKSLLAQEDEPQVKQEVIEAILAIHDSPALLATLLRDKDIFLRKSVATRLAGMAIHGMSIDAAGPTLEEVVRIDDNAEIRTIAQEALREMNRGRKGR
jgi:hypothetical protein